MIVYSIAWYLLLRGPSWELVYFPHNHKFGRAGRHWSSSSSSGPWLTRNLQHFHFSSIFGEGFEGWVGNFSATSAPRYLTHVSGLVPRYSPIPKPFGYGSALKYLFLCTSEHSHFHFQGLHHPHQSHPNTLSPYNQQALKLSHSQLVSAFIAMAFSNLSSSRCLWYWMLKSSLTVWSIHCTAINLDISCGSSYPSSQPLLPLISFETLQSMQCFIVQDILQISSVVLDIIKTISISPRRTIPIISPSPRTFWASNGIPMTKHHDKRSSV